MRGGIAFGPIVLGSSLGGHHSAVLGASSSKRYREAILIGIPVVQAYEVESEAPPFGVRVHVSARSFAPEGKTPHFSSYWRWHEATGRGALAVALKAKLKIYFEFMQAHECELDYPKKDRERHEALYREYFWSVEETPVVEKSPAADQEAPSTSKPSVV